MNSNSRIEQLINEIEEFIESCKPQTFSQTKVVVPKDELYELLTELKLKTPEEIKRYQKIIANRDSIISDAKAHAEKMVEEAQEYANALVQEHEIMVKAYAAAEEVVKNADEQAEATVAAANEDAENIRMSALKYTEEMINNLETIISRTLDGARANSEALVSGLSYNLNILMENKDALQGQLYEAAVEEPSEIYEDELEEDYEEDSYEEESYEEDEAEALEEEYDDYEDID